jgi:hypothetical protein
MTLPSRLKARRVAVTFTMLSEMGARIACIERGMMLLERRVFAAIGPAQVKAAGLAMVLAVFAFAIAPLAAARAEDSLYTAAKVTVDTTAKDAVAAKATGMAEAQRLGLQTVLKRLVPYSAYAQLPELSQEDVESMVDGVSVRSEQVSTTRYLATLDVSFNAQAVRQLLASYNIGVSEERAPMISVLPLIIDGDTVKSEGPEGWRQAWLGLDLTHGMVPANVLQPRPELSAQAVKAILAGDESAFSAIRSAYGDPPLVLAVASADRGKFVTRLVGADGTGAINFGRSDKIGTGGVTAASRDAAAIAFAILENRWKVTQAEGPVTEVRQEEGRQEEQPAKTQPEDVARSVVAEVEFSGLKDWQDMRTKLMNVPGIQALEVNSLSARGASISFDYAGSLGRLQKELEQSGFSFENRADNFVLRSREGGARAN